MACRASTLLGVSEGTKRGGRKMETISRDNSLEQFNWKGKEKNGWDHGVWRAIHADPEVNQVESRGGNVRAGEKPMGV